MSDNISRRNDDNNRLLDEVVSLFIAANYLVLNPPPCPRCSTATYSNPSENLLLFLEIDFQLIKDESTEASTRANILLYIVIRNVTITSYNFV